MRPFRPLYEASGWSSNRLTSGAAASSIRSRLLVARRNDVGMYTVTAMPALASRAQVALAGVGQHGDHARRRNLPLEDLAHAGQRSAGSDADDERVEPPADRVEDLERGGAAVRLGVRRVLDLLGHEVVGMLPQQLTRRMDRARH